MTFEDDGGDQRAHHEVLRRSPARRGDTDALREREPALQEQGNLFLAQGDLGRALKSYRDGLAIADKLAKLDPSNRGRPTEDAREEMSPRSSFILGGTASVLSDYHFWAP
jgi:hypothetical protein